MSVEESLLPAKSPAVSSVSSVPKSAEPPDVALGNAWARAFLGALMLFTFLVGVQALSGGIKGLGGGTLDSFMTAVTNPFLGLVTGILATTLVQSSSVTTSLIVGMVASGTLSLGAAIPMVMGANIGTTVTNSIASLAQAGRPAEFKRAFAAATCHDFFNYLSVAFFLPLELATGFLAKSSAAVNQMLPEVGGVTYKSPFKAALKSCVGLLEGAVGFVTEDQTFGAILLALLGIALIFTSLTMIVKIMRRLVLSRMEAFVNRLLGKGWRGGLIGILAGIGLTVMVQSSSITTSVMVPLAGAGLVRLQQVFPVTVGANIGTTVTALLASMAISGPAAMVARQIALVHLLFNLSGTLLFYVPARTRGWSIALAEGLAETAAKSKRWALSYVVLAFYGVPALLVFFTR